MSLAMKNETKEFLKKFSDNKQATSKANEDKTPPVVSPLITCFADVEPETVSWLWQPYIPLGKITTLESDPGEGKTFLALSVAAILSKGALFPDSDGIPRGEREPARTIYMSCEDGLADTLRPRLDSLGADCSNIFALTGQLTTYADGEQQLGQICLQDLRGLEGAVEAYKPALVIIDPIQGFLGAGLDMHRSNEVRPVLAGIARLAEKYRCAMVLIRHLGKSSQDRSIYRGLGSIDFAAAARSILLAGRDPQDKQRRALIQIKNSLAVTGPGIGYEISESGFFWTGVTDLTAEDVLAPDQRADDRDGLRDAKDFLVNALADGPRSPKEIQQEAKEMGIKNSTLRSAREVLTKAKMLRAYRVTGDLAAWRWELTE